MKWFVALFLVIKSHKQWQIEVAGRVRGGVVNEGSFKEENPSVMKNRVIKEGDRKRKSALIRFTKKKLENPPQNLL